MGLGYLGLEDRVHAIEYLDKARGFGTSTTKAHKSSVELCE